MGDAAKGRVDEEICRRDLPPTVGLYENLGALSRYALWLCFPLRRV
jgi:hypothetical protein